VQGVNGGHSESDRESPLAELNKDKRELNLRLNRRYGEVAYADYWLRPKGKAKSRAFLQPTR